jgi:hypothetical protein
MHPKSIPNPPVNQPGVYKVEYIQGRHRAWPYFAKWNAGQWCLAASTLWQALNNHNRSYDLYNNQILSWELVKPLNQKEDEVKTDEIPNKELIQAVLDGKTVQWKSTRGWRDLATQQALLSLVDPCDDLQYRIKPELQEKWIALGVGRHSNWSAAGCAGKGEAMALAQAQAYADDIAVQLLIDPDTHDVTIGEVHKRKK